MKRTVLITSVIFAIAASFIIGAKYGAYQFQLLNTGVEASLLAGELEALRTGKANLLIPGKEVELDGALVLHGNYLKSGMPWLFWPESQLFENERYLQKVLAYRKQHPSQPVNQSLREAAVKVLEAYKQ